MSDAGVAQVLESIAANVRRLRTRRGLTQEKLAEVSDLDLRLVQRVERARTNMKIAALVALARALGVRPAEFLRPGRLPEVKRGRPPSRRRASKAPRGPTGETDSSA